MTTRPLSVLARAVPLLAAAVVIPACSDGGTNVQRLTPSQVQGVYNVCTLRFAPSQGALPTADILATVVNTTPPAPKQPPSLTLSGQAYQYQLVYTRRSDNFLQQLNGSVDLGQTNVVTDFPDESQSDIVRELLLPEALTLTFTDSPRRLTAASGFTYDVRRSDYARAAGISETNLADRINGTLTATFATGACP